MDNQDPMTLITSLLMNRAQTADSNAKSFADMLKERRTFVQGQENKVGDMTQSSIVNGANGVPINPVDAVNGFIGYHTDNANKTSQLTQEGAIYGNQSQSALEALASILSAAAGRNVQTEQLKLQREEQNRKNFESGYDPSAADGSGGVGGPAAVAEIIKQGGQDLLGEAPDDKTRSILAQKIIKAGGVEAYRRTIKPSLLKKSILNTIDTLLNADTKPITGQMQVGPMIPGSSAKYTEATYNQLKGMLSLDNVKYLKGQGQVSDAERQLLETASSKLRRDLSDEDFKKVLLEVKSALGVSDSKDSGSVKSYDDLYKKYGL